MAWTKIISAIMIIMIPAVLREEALLTAEQKQEQQDKIKEHHTAHISAEDQTFRKLVHVNESVHVSGSANAQPDSQVSDSVRTVSTVDDAAAPARLETVTEANNNNNNTSTSGNAPTNEEASSNPAVVSARVSLSMKEAVAETPV